MISLEKRSALINEFKTEFRKRKLWRVGWSGYDITEPAEGDSDDAD
jgi:hypothetical protein